MSEAQLVYYKERHEHVLSELLDATKIPASRLKQAIRYVLFPGGKRLRPLLIYACGELFEIPIESLDIMAVAIEIMHAYSLVHDDLPAMDNDDLRRGLPTCHRAFDEATAILVGDGLQALAIDFLVSHLPKTLSAAQILSIVQTLVQAAGPSGMVSGQSLDLSDLQTSVSVQHLETIHHLKTGQLMLACINMVLAAGQPTAQDIAALRLFGHHLGLLFQMQDDYLDQYATHESLGKGRSSDLANQKQTFANLYPKETLADLVLHHITTAQDALEPFKNRDQTLRALLSKVQERI